MTDRPVFAILAEGSFGLEGAKTAASAIRYLPDRVAAVIDAEHAGRQVADVLGFGEGIPVVADLDAALEADPRPEALLIGGAPQGGGLPEAWRPLLTRALRRGLDLWSGLHFHLSEDPELARVAEQEGRRLVDLRKSPAELPVATARSASTGAFRVLTVGTDCNVGKLTTSLEVADGLRRRGVTARVGATGQTGILVTGRGIAVDAVVADFVAGAAEVVTLEAAAEDPDVVLVEGQGSLLHPGYSGVTLGLLHGSVPQAMILCWMPSRETLYGGNYDWVEIPPLDEVVALYEEAAGWTRPAEPARVVGISCCTYDLGEEAARRAVERAREVTGLPATDPVRFGTGPLVEAVSAARAG